MSQINKERVAVADRITVHRLPTVYSGQIKLMSIKQLGKTILSLLHRDALTEKVYIYFLITKLI